jgi:hypothetical protein
MISFITGVSLPDYIRRRWLTVAAFELQKSLCQYIYVALGETVNARISFSLKSPWGLWMIIHIYHYAGMELSEFVMS